MLTQTNHLNTLDSNLILNPYTPEPTTYIRTLHTVIPNSHM